MRWENPLSLPGYFISSAKALFSVRSALKSSGTPASKEAPSETAGILARHRAVERPAPARKLPGDPQADGSSCARRRDGRDRGGYFADERARCGDSPRMEALAPEMTQRVVAS
jgi:hypothetical protein